MRWIALVLIVPILAGCLDDAPTNAVSGMEVVVEDSMAPDFSGMGPDYPVLLVHRHWIPSQHQERDWRENPVVCANIHGEPLPLYLAARDDMAPCMGPAADPATGRVYMQREHFAEADPAALVVHLGGCDGGITMLGEDRVFDYRAGANSFRVALHDNGTFSVDETWIRPGTALKIGWYQDEGSQDHEEYYRVSFDNPGRWLKARVAGYDEDLDKPIPERPSQGTGLVADLDLHAADPAAAIEAAAKATPGLIEGLAALRLVHDGDRLTEAHIAFATDNGTVTWYGAGRTGDAVRLLGRIDPGPPTETVPLDAFAGALDRPWRELRHGIGDMTDVRLDPTKTWSTAGGHHLALDLAVATGTACEGGCVQVHTDDPVQGAGWRLLVRPESSETGSAATLQVVAFDGDDPVASWWHVPPKP